MKIFNMTSRTLLISTMLTTFILAGHEYRNLKEFLSEPVHKGEIKNKYKNLKEFLSERELMVDPFGSSEKGEILDFSDENMMKLENESQKREQGFRKLIEKGQDLGLPTNEKNMSFDNPEIKKRDKAIRKLSEENEDNDNMTVDVNTDEHNELEGEIKSGPGSSHSSLVSNDLLSHVSETASQKLLDMGVSHLSTTEEEVDPNDLLKTGGSMHSDDSIHTPSVHNDSHHSVESHLEVIEDSNEEKLKNATNDHPLNNEEDLDTLQMLNKEMQDAQNLSTQSIHTPQEEHSNHTDHSVKTSEPLLETNESIKTPVVMDNDEDELAKMNAMLDQSQQEHEKNNIDVDTDPEYKSGHSEESHHSEHKSVQTPLSGTSDHSEESHHSENKSVQTPLSGTSDHSEESHHSKSENSETKNPEHVNTITKNEPDVDYETPNELMHDLEDENKQIDQVQVDNVDKEHQEDKSVLDEVDQETIGSEVTEEKIEDMVVEDVEEGDNKIVKKEDGKALHAENAVVDGADSRSEEEHAEYSAIYKNLGLMLIAFFFVLRI